MELKDRTFLLVDVETTGFNSDTNQILEVGMLAIRNGEVFAELQTYIKHKEYNVTAKALETNGVNLIEHEKRGMAPEDAVYEILEFFELCQEDPLFKERYIIIGQNVDFDLRFLESLFLKTKRIRDYRSFVSYRKMDIMQLAMIKNLEGKIKLEKQDLDTIVKAVNINIGENRRHTALGDCYIEFEVLNKLLSL